MDLATIEKELAEERAKPQHERDEGVIRVLERFLDGARRTARAAPVPPAVVGDGEALSEGFRRLELNMKEVTKEVVRELKRR